MTDKLITAADAGLLSCHSCSLLSREGPGQHAELECPRCGASLHKRKPNSLACTRALVIAAFICYIPANLLPMTVVTSLGVVQSDTIMSGVIYFLQHGEWPIGLVILLASVVVPLTKLFIRSVLPTTSPSRSITSISSSCWNSIAASTHLAPFC